MQHYDKVGVGVSVILTWKQHILLAQRKGSHGAGTWDTPGGHLEPGERTIDCAVRETQEETGLLLDPVQIQDLGYTEDFFEQEKKHYISCVVACEIDGEKTKLFTLESNKFASDWKWFRIDELPCPLFIPVKNALDKFINRG